MAYTMTFTSLQDDLRKYLERGFSEDADPYVYGQLPRLINMAERRIARDLKVQGFIRVVTTQINQGVTTLKKPDRWRDTVSLTVETPEGKKHLFGRSYDYCRSYWPDETVEAEPEFYADYDYNHWMITPTPDANYGMEIVYYEMPPLLDDENQTNWLTAYAPSVLLYGALLEATPFVKNDERIQLWQGYYNDATQKLTGEDMGKVLDRVANRSEP